MAQSTHVERPLRRPEVRLHQAGDENVVLNPDTGSLCKMNETAMAIWHLCDGETTPDEMIAVVCEVSQLHRDIVAEDIDRILRDFDELGLLGWVE